MTEFSDEEYYYKLDNLVQSSCQQLRKVFKLRWNTETGNEWNEDNSEMPKVIKQVGKSVFYKLKHAQTVILESGSTEDWDLTALALVILNLGASAKYEIENNAICELKEIRNILAHHSSKKISSKVYQNYKKKIQDALKSLNLSQKQIKKLVQKAGVTSSLTAHELVKKLFDSAENFDNNGQHKKAIKCYTEAIETPSLLPINLASAYEHRALCYLRSVGNPNSDKKIIEQANNDAVKALELNEYSWRAHYATAQCYRFKGELREALKYYQRALSISPVQKEVRMDFEACKVLCSSQERQENLTDLPMNLQERVEHLENETGLRLTEEEFLRVNQIGGAAIAKGQDHVFRGHQYFDGWGVQQDYFEAASYYAKAAKLKNAEGMYNLAQCYKYGKGVKLDVETAFDICMETAKLDPRMPGQQTSLKYNIGVAAAEHALGMFYEDGIHVVQNQQEAAGWYKKAMEHGVGQAANNLGNMYIEGRGIGMDKKMAELCWKQGVALQDINAPACLYAFYIKQLEPDLAWEMVEIGRKMGNDGLLRLADNELKIQIGAVRQKRKKFEEDIMKFESENLLDIKGLTFLERVDRFLKQNMPEVNSLVKAVEQTTCKYPENWAGKVRGYSLETFCELEKRAKQGSVTAHKILETMKLAECAEYILCSITHQAIDKGCMIGDLIELLYKACTLESHHIYLSTESMEKLKKILCRLFKEKCDAKGDEDMKIRICYVYFCLAAGSNFEDMYPIEVLKQGVNRYPDNISYYSLLSDLLGGKGKNELGLKFADKGLEKFPNDVNLLYSKAVHLKLGVKPTDKSRVNRVIEAFQKFVSVAAEDHRKLPEAYYQMSNVALEKVLNLRTGEKKILEMVKKYFDLGEEAERKQLPCYLPYAESPGKTMVRTVLGLKKMVEVKPEPKVYVNPVQSILDRKSYLKSPSRAAVILIHRQSLHKSFIRSAKEPRSVTTVAPKLKQPCPKRMSGMKPITLREMNPTEDHIFENRMLDLTIMDDMNTTFISIHLIAEDENGDMTRLYIYNVEKSKENLRRFKAGSRICIINPYMRIGAQDITHGIRCDDSRCIVYVEEVTAICRYCGEGNALQKCSKCKRPYCSRECQTLDWKEMQHKLVCSVPY